MKQENTELNNELTDVVDEYLDRQDSGMDVDGKLEHFIWLFTTAIVLGTIVHMFLG